MAVQLTPYDHTLSFEFEVFASFSPCIQVLQTDDVGKTLSDQEAPGVVCFIDMCTAVLQTEVAVVGMQAAPFSKPLHEHPWWLPGNCLWFKKLGESCPAPAPTMTATTREAREGRKQARSFPQIGSLPFVCKSTARLCVRGLSLYPCHNHIIH